MPRLFGSFRVNLGAIAALLSAGAFWLLLFRTYAGFQMQVGGLAPAAARYAGFSSRRALWTALLLSGGRSRASYLAVAYPMLLALGGVAFERLSEASPRRWLRPALGALCWGWDWSASPWPCRSCPWRLSCATSRRLDCHRGARSATGWARCRSTTRTCSAGSR